VSKPIILSAESTCDLGAELIAQNNVNIYPFHVILGDDTFSDGVDLTPDDIYRVYAEKGILPHTAAINMEEYTEWFSQWTAQGLEVIHISLGHGISCSYNNARMAAEEMEGVYVVDSGNLSTGLGLLVLEAADRIAAGLPAAQIVAELEEIKARISSSFVIDTLEFLHKGGRCSSLAMMGANLLKLKPCITVDNASSAMTVGKKYRGTLEKALEQYVADQLQGRTDLDTKRIFITHSGISDERVALVRSLVEKYAQFDNIYVTRAGCTISAHCGPNTLGVLFITK
jgi:DegV family protein with EDD domain